MLPSLLMSLLLIVSDHTVRILRLTRVETIQKEVKLLARNLQKYCDLLRCKRQRMLELDIIIMLRSSLVFFKFFTVT